MRLHGSFTGFKSANDQASRSKAWQLLCKFRSLAHKQRTDDAYCLLQSVSDQG